MSEKERVEHLLKSVEMLNDAMRLHSLIQRLLTQFFRVLNEFVAEQEKKGGEKGEGNLH